jgi:SAM-dependent methyltransferase
MAVDLSGLNHVLAFKQFIKGNCLQIGRQGLHYAGSWADADGQKAAISNTLLKGHGVSFTAEETVIDGDGHTEKLFRMLGAENVDTMDYSPYENATIVHDLNLPVPEELHDKYDYILDCGTMEHIFDVKTVTDNIKKMLKVGGVFSIVTPCNNFAGHGFYQFSPELFRTVFSNQAGYESLGMFLYELEKPLNSFRVFQIPDPRKGARQEFKTSEKECYLAFTTQKIEQSNHNKFQQSDYLAIWGEMV